MIIASSQSTLVGADLKASVGQTSKLDRSRVALNQERSDPPELLNSAVGKTAKAASLEIVPKNLAFGGSNASHRILVMAKFRDGLDRDVTAKSHIWISNSALAKVDKEGLVLGLADGETELFAGYDGRRASTRLRILDTHQSHASSFVRDISAVLTRQGCNSTECHGSVVGRGGFKLSFDALYPQEDYHWVQKGGVYSVFSLEAKSPTPPRIDLTEPEQSLLLKKPALEIPHGGGLRFSHDSEAYKTILTWIKDGAPYGEERNNDGAKSEETVAVFPKEIVLDLHGTQQLLVVRYSGQRQEDLSSEVRYRPNNDDLIAVSDAGVVRAKAVGQTSVIIHVAGHAPLSVQVGVIARSLENYPAVPRKNLIDDYIFAKLRRLSIVPSQESSDSEFLRRVCLDITGTLPPTQRVREFLASTDPGKRDKLIEILLNSPEYVDYWTFRFADLFRVSLWAQNAILKSSQMYWEWIRQSIAQNKPYDQIARERIAAQGYDGPVMHYQSVNEFRDPQDIMAEQVRVFLGRRLDCAQCHNHPYETWSQNQYWGMAAFFGRLTRLQDQVDFVLMDYPGGHGEFGKGIKLIHPRTKKEVEPTFLDGNPLSESYRADPRLGLAEWMTSSSNPYFAEAITNRIWSHFFGRGIVDPVDDFRSTNPPTHPELLAALANNFREHGCNLKYLIKLIVRSRTYQLSRTPNETSKNDTANYSRALSRPLDAEVLLDAINQFAGIDEDFERWRGGRGAARMRAINLMAPDLLHSQFLEVYGQPNRLMVPQRKVEANLGQALHMLVGSTYTSKLSKEGGRVDSLLKSGIPDRQIIEDCYLAALSRFPTTQELARIGEEIGKSPERREAIEDLVWSLITSREFAYNH